MANCRQDSKIIVLLGIGFPNTILAQMMKEFGLMTDGTRCYVSHGRCPLCRHSESLQGEEMRLLFSDESFVSLEQPRECL